MDVGRPKNHKGAPFYLQALLLCSVKPHFDIRHDLPPQDLRITAPYDSLCYYH